jgi:hypothetical protein
MFYATAIGAGFAIRIREPEPAKLTEGSLGAADTVRTAGRSVSSGGDVLCGAGTIASPRQAQSRSAAYTICSSRRGGVALCVALTQHVQDEPLTGRRGSAAPQPERVRVDVPHGPLSTKPP